MTAPSRFAPPARGARRRVVVAPAAAALLVSAWVHVDLAAPPWAVDGQLTLASLFLAQALVAAAVAAWALVRPSRLALGAAVLVGLGSLAALVVPVYVRVPSIGPLPALYEPLWYGAKVTAAAAAGAAAATALLALWFGPASRSGAPPG